MKLAAAIRYGGQLVEAEDVNYAGYKELGLLCPNCKSPVFLQSESLRRLDTKVAKVPSHFKHFEVKNVGLIQFCEARVAKYDRKEVERRQTIARNQRLRILQRRFWSIILRSHRMTQVDQIVDSLTQSPAIDSVLLNIEDFCEQLAIDKSFLIEPTLEHIEGFRDGTYLDCGKLDCEFHSRMGNKEKAVFDHLTNKVNLDMHQLICLEVIDFLLVKSSYPVLFELVKVCFYMAGVSLTNKNAPVDKDGYFNRETMFTAVCSHVSIILASLDWTAELQ